MDTPQEALCLYKAPAIRAATEERLSELSLGQTHLPEHERVVQRDFPEVVIPSRRAAVARAHIRLQQQRVIVSLHRHAAAPPVLRLPSKAPGCR